MVAGPRVASVPRMLPFTRDQFIAVFADYNRAAWPAPVFAYLLGAAMVAMLLRPSRAADRFIGSGLGLMWIWTGIAYHALRFSAINPMALAFAALFVAQGALLFQAVSVDGGLRFRGSGGPARLPGAVLIAYAAIVYPLVGLWTGHDVRALPMFGITPCPVTLFTLGLLLLAAPPVPRRVLPIPLLWSLIGASAAFLLDVVQDWPLLLGAVVIPWIAWRDRRPPRRSATSAPAPAPLGRR